MLHVSVLIELLVCGRTDGFYNLSTVTAGWEAHSPLLHDDFNLAEPVIAQQGVLLQLTSGLGHGGEVKGALCSQLRQHFKLACQAGRYQVSEAGLWH